MKIQAIKNRFHLQVFPEIGKKFNIWTVLPMLLVAEIKFSAFAYHLKKDSGSNAMKLPIYAKKTN